MRISKLFWAGLILFIVGVGPLLVVGLFDPKSNPVGLGLLAWATFWPAVIMIVVGLILSIIAKLRR